MDIIVTEGNTSEDDFTDPPPRKWKMSSKKGNKFSPSPILELPKLRNPPPKIKSCKLRDLYLCM